MNLAQSVFTPIVQWSYFYTKLFSKSVRKMFTERNIYTEKLENPPNTKSLQCMWVIENTMIVGKAYCAGKVR